MSAQDEMNYLRSQRLHLATIQLATGWRYDQQESEPGRLARTLGWLLTVYALWKAVV
jgi:hypothetical protein